MVQVALSPKQADVFQSQEPELFYCAGNGAGKTFTIALIALLECQQLRGNRGTICGPTFPQLNRGTIVNVHRELEAWGLVESIHYVYNKSEHTLTFTDRAGALAGSGWDYLSLDVKSSRLEGMEYGFALIDEIAACDKDKVGAIITRVRKPGASHRIRYFGYPPHMGHWAQQRAFLEPGERGHLPMVKATTYDNLKRNGGALEDSYVEQIERMYPPGTSMHRRKILAEFAAMEGLVYSCFDPARHVVRWQDIPEAIRERRGSGYFGCMDFGYNPSPLVFLSCCLDPPDESASHESVIWVLSEHYAAGKLLSEHAVELRKHYIGGPVFGDHDAQVRAEIEALMGWRITPGRKDINSGIDAVRQRFETGRLMVCAERCPNLVRELGLYRYDDKTDRRQDRAEEVPLKKDDHAPDALRYGVATIDLRGIRP